MKKLVTIDIETSSPLGPFLESVDMMHKKCSCEKGEYREMYLHDDWNGTLHCNVCDKVTDRYITRSDYREEQINKILQ
jgi:hypothetical protein